MIKSLKCEFENYVIEGDRYYTDNKPIATLLLLHGGGLKTTRRVFDKMRIDLLNNNIESYAFDFIGHGENNEELYNTSLHSKVMQAKAFIDKHINVPFSMLGDSMGGYISIKLLEFYNVKSLILMVPALYTKYAYNVNFGNSFSDIIRKYKSWENSDAFDIIKEYKENVLLITAGDDSVVPHELTDELRNSLAEFKEYIIENGEHNMFKYIYDSNEYKEIIKLISSCLINN